MTWHQNILEELSTHNRAHIRDVRSKSVLQHCISKKAYYQIVESLESPHPTAITMFYGFYGQDESKMSSFKEFLDYRDTFMLLYLDDLLVFSKTFKETSSILD